MATFYMMVQKQDIAENMPLEDPTTEWQEVDSPYLEVARIRFVAQDSTDPVRVSLCGQMAFVPWHDLSVHRPPGQFNRMRPAVYSGSARCRHANDQTMPPRHLAWLSLPDERAGHPVDDYGL